jgi:hypothetical protein
MQCAKNNKSRRKGGLATMKQSKAVVKAQQDVQARIAGIKAGKLVSIADALYLLRQQGVSISTTSLINWVKTGKVKGHRIGKKFYIPVWEIQKLLEGSDDLK